jgi:hypothetical protein
MQLYNITVMIPTKIRVTVPDCDALVGRPISWIGQRRERDNIHDIVRVITQTVILGNTEKLLGVGVSHPL